MKNILISQLRQNQITTTLYTVDTNFQNLVTSISLFGVLEPLIVFPIQKTSGVFQVVSGNRRLNAASQLGLKEVPCTIIEPIELTESLVSAHQETREKQPSDIIRELRILEKEFGLRQGARGTNPIIQKAKEYKASLVKEYNKSTIDRLRQYDKKVSELVGEDSEAYSKYMNELDRSRNISGSLKKVESILEKTCNEKVAGNLSMVDGKGFTIHQGSCDDMPQVEEGTVATIVTSPPYYQLREYHNGIEKSDQLGQEETVEEFVENLARVFDEAKRVLKHDGSLFINIADNVQGGRKLGVPYKFISAMMERGWILNDTIVWSKVNPMYQSHKRTVASHEYIFHFVKTVEFYYDRSWIKDMNFDPHQFTYGNPKGQPALRSNWTFDGHTLTTCTPNNHDLREACKEYGMSLSHSATFPKEIPLVAILCTSRPGDVVMDMFSGTGTTGQVALEQNREYVGFELSSVYLKFSEIRLTELTNKLNPILTAA